MKHLSLYKFFENNTNFSVAQELKTIELLKDSFKKYIEKKSKYEITVDGWGEITIFSGPYGELVRISNTGFRSFNVYFNIHLHLDLEEDLLNICTVDNEIYSRDYEAAIKFLDDDNYKKLRILKKTLQFNI